MRGAAATGNRQLPAAARGSVSGELAKPERPGDGNDDRTPAGAGATGAEAASGGAT